MKKYLLIVIGDFKSASSIKDDETIHKYELQLAAYIIAFEEIYNKKVSALYTLKISI